MATPTKPIRIPPTMSEEDRHYLEIKRNNQNNVYQLTVLFIELLRNNQGVGHRVLRVAFNQAHRYIFPEATKEKSKQPSQEPHANVMFDNHKINSLGE